MSAYKGWIARVRLPTQQRTNEPMNPRYGDGSRTEFYTFWRPITDSGGNTTNDENDVIVYLDGTELKTQVTGEVLATGDGTTTTFSGTLANYTVKAGTLTITDGTETFTDNGDGTLTGDAGGSGTINYETGEYSVTFNTAPASGTDITADYYYLPYTLSGSEGKITMDSAPGSGVEVTVTYYTGGVLGYVTSISLSVDRDSEAFYHLQSATPAEVVDGTIDITVDLERAFIDRNFMEIIRKDETAEVTLEIDIDGDGTYEYSIPCKISSFNPSIDIDGVVVASISLIGRSIS